jgi:hypothetical protein
MLTFLFFYRLAFKIILFIIFSAKMHMKIRKIKTLGLLIHLDI